MRAIISIILMIVLTVASATAGIRLYCDTTPAIPGLTIQGTPDYSTSYSYDLNGNPTQIYRKGIAHKYASGSNRQWQYDEIDNLYIDYRGNQVNFTDDSCPWGYYENAPGYIEESYDDNEYTWDANGNMTKDLNRGITSIQYNLQNQPIRIVYNDRHYEGRTYNSAGQKLRTIHTVFVTSSTSSSTSTAALITENKRDYYGEDLVYRNDTLEMVLTDVGYVDARGNYHYYILDYQGNVRQVADAQGNVIEQNDYYPYGGLFGESASRQSYKYSGKELERMNGLNTYDFHARPYYYPAIIFHSPDLLSEKTPWLSPYLYCAGNPIMLIDPTGKYFESLWDAANIVMGVNSLWNNIKEGNVGAAIVDGVGVVVDAVAIALPVVPGGASSIIKAARAADDVVDVAKTTSKVADKAADVVKMEKHHIIPKQLMDHPLVKEAISEGFKFNGSDNIISLEKYVKNTNTGRHGNHPAYTDKVAELLDLNMKEKGTASERLHNVIDNVRTEIETKPNIKINDLYK